MESSLPLLLPLSLDQLMVLLRQLPASEKKKLILLLEQEMEVTETDLVLTHQASEQVLARDWNSPKEDQAWQHL